MQPCCRYAGSDGTEAEARDEDCFGLEHGKLLARGTVVLWALVSCPLRCAGTDGNRSDLRTSRLTSAHRGIRIVRMWTISCRRKARSRTDHAGAGHPIRAEWRRPCDGFRRDKTDLQNRRCIQSNPQAAVRATS